MNLKYIINFKLIINIFFSWSYILIISQFDFKFIDENDLTTFINDLNLINKELFNN